MFKTHHRYLSFGCFSLIRDRNNYEKLERSVNSEPKKLGKNHKKLKKIASQ